MEERGQDVVVVGWQENVGGGVVCCVHEDNNETTPPTNSNCQRRLHEQEERRKLFQSPRHVTFSSFEGKVKTCFYFVEMSAQWFFGFW